MSSEKSLNFVIPIALLVFFGVVYAMSLRADNGFVSFILIGIALVTIVYWTRIIKKMVVTNKPKFATRDTETKNWVYDLIKGDQETVFVAEVPGPEDKIMVRLIDKVLYVRGSQGFSKEVPIEGTIEMEIADFKYRNGVLTLRIKIYKLFASSNFCGRYLSVIFVKPYFENASNSALRLIFRNTSNSFFHIPS